MPHIIATEAGECCPQFSPDGKWIANISNELGRNNVYISPYPATKVKWLISEEEEGGAQPVWSSGGKELFYRSGNKMMVASIQTGDQTLNASKPKVLFEGSDLSIHSSPSGFQFDDVSPDGRFLMLKEEGVKAEPAQITVILNWFEELKRLVPTNESTEIANQKLTNSP